MLVQGDGEVAALLLDRPDTEVNAVGRDGVTALGLACLQVFSTSCYSVF